MTPQNFDNRTIFSGENLDFLRGLNSDSVDLIATDPPFNKSKDFHATPDSLADGASFQDRWTYDKDVHPAWEDWAKSKHPKLAEAIESARHAHSESMGAFLCWLSVRLIEMKRILKPTGSIYLQCDYTAVHYIKACMDAIFGHRNFKNDIIWKRANSTKAHAKGFGRQHDNILYYTNSKEFTCNKAYIPHSEKYKSSGTYREDERGMYRMDPLQTTSAKFNQGRTPTEWRGVTAYWLHTLEKREQMWADGLVVQSKRGVYSKKNYGSWEKGTPVSDIWVDDHVLPLQGGAKEDTGYPTQKPISLYERIIKTSSNVGDWVLDPFCGCATTLIAAERLGRRWIGMDLWKKTADLVCDRMERETLIEHGAYTDGRPEVNVKDEPLSRTDDGVKAAKYLKAIWGTTEKGPRMSKDWMMGVLMKDLRELTDDKLICPGCGLEQARDANFELDHVDPKSDFGSDTIGNRIPLCTPCNSDKSNRKTMSALHKHNKDCGYMKNWEYVRKLFENMRRRAQAHERKFFAKIK